ncbi:MAG: hypothetical protein MH252_06980 [Thermosynechococcaceae cyanobacterium MS004]|nr:hypothetical protein [Thermosynechococcaceae cyanobacterium MS004]
MGNRDSLLEIKRELLEIGQEAYQFVERCPICRERFREFWERLDWIDGNVQKLFSIEEEHQFLQYRVTRYLEFGEPLD